MQVCFNGVLLWSIYGDKLCLTLTLDTVELPSVGFSCETSTDSDPLQLFFKLNVLSWFACGCKCGYTVVTGLCMKDCSQTANVYESVHYNKTLRTILRI